MSTITKERVANLLQFNSEGSDCQANAEQWEVHELARIALASIEAEVVCVIDQSNLDYLKSGSDADVWPASRTEMGGVLLYRAAPPAPVLPRDLEEIIFTIVNAMADEKLRNDESELFSLAKKYIEHAKSKLGAAMLQDAEPVSQRYKLPFEQWLSQQTGTIDVECGCVMTEVFFHWLRVAYEAGNSPHFLEIGNSSTKHFRENAETSTKCPCCGRKPLKNKTCSVAGCNGKHVARGFCVKHYAIERKKEPSRRESIRAADKRYRARKAAAPQQEVTK